MKVLYLRIFKPLYGCMDSVLIWYALYVKTLKSQGFVVNSYDRCIENSTIYVKQCMIAWYVDDIKLSHVDDKANTRIIGVIAEHFGELTVSREKKHRFLRMYIYFLGNGRVSLFMKDYME